MTAHTSSRVSNAGRAPVPLPGTSPRRRVLEAVAFVAVWMSAGYLLGLSSNAYLLLGIPLTAAFQLGVRRRPLRELFAAGTTRFALDRNGVAIAAVLAITPGYYAGGAFTAGDWTTFGWYLAAMVGAVAAAFSVRASSILATVRSAAVPVAVGATGMVAVFGAVHILRPAPRYPRWLPSAPWPSTPPCTTRPRSPSRKSHSEEPSTRTCTTTVTGAAGSPPCSCPHCGGCGTCRSPPASRCHGWSSSSSWCMSPSGFWLSFSWRRTRNLGGPALAHAINDAVRNATMLGL